MSAAQTELELAHRQIEQLQRELAQSRLAIEDFTYSVSHDLRASLRHVVSYLKVIREDIGDGIDPAITAHLNTASGAASHMGRLMDGLLELSKVGRAELQVTDVDLQRLVSDLCHQADRDAMGRQIRWRIAPDLPTVRGDIALLGQVLTRLLSNALKFTVDCPQPTVEISWTRNADGQCELHLRDNGVGFDPRFQDRLFRVFQRLHSPREFDGIGVGLALARQIVERHGGTIRARGDLAPGCEISLTLPLAQGAGA